MQKVPPTTNAPLLLRQLYDPNNNYLFEKSKTVPKKDI